MNRGTEILLARREAKVSQRQLEIRLELPSGTIGAIEHNRITVSDEDHNRIHDAIREMSQGKKEDTCVAPLASAST